MEGFKHGETPIDTNLRRTIHGLTVDVKVHPDIEEYMKLQSHGETTHVRLIGKHWKPETGKELVAYVIPQGENLKADDGSYLDLARLGYQLVDHRPEGNFTNISFLRLVGASEGAGVRFHVPGVYSFKHLQAIREAIGAAERKFYIEYLRPINMRVSINIADLAV